MNAQARDQSWPGTLMVLGIFVLIISFWWVGTRTLVTYMELARWFALFAFVGNLLPYKGVALRLGMERLEWFLFNLLAVGPFVFSALLWINLLVHAPERYAILHFTGGIEGVRHYWMQQGELPPATWLDVANAEEARSIGTPIGEHLIGVSTGVLGYEVISTYERFGGEDNEASIPHHLLELEREAFAQQANLAHHGAFGGQLHFVAVEGAREQHHQQ